MNLCGSGRTPPAKGLSIRPWQAVAKRTVNTIFYPWYFENRPLEPGKLFKAMEFFGGSRDGAVVRALAFHQCGPGSIPGLDVICGLSLLLVLFSAPRGFSPGTPVFPSPQKPTFLNSNSIRNARAFNTWAPGSGDWATTPHTIELK